MTRLENNVTKFKAIGLLRRVHKEISRVSIATLGEGKFIKIVMGVFTGSRLSKKTPIRHIQKRLFWAQTVSSKKKFITKHLKCGKCHILRQSLACYWIVGQADFCDNLHKIFQEVYFSEFLKYFIILVYDAASWILISIFCEIFYPAMPYTLQHYIHPAQSSRFFGHSSIQTKIQ